MLYAKQKENNKPYATMWNELKQYGTIKAKIDSKDLQKIRAGIAKNKHRDIYFCRLHPGARIQFSVEQLENSKLNLSIVLLHANIHAEMF